MSHRTVEKRTLQYYATITEIGARYLYSYGGYTINGDLYTIAANLNYDTSLKVAPIYVNIKDKRKVVEWIRDNGFIEAI